MCVIVSGASVLPARDTSIQRVSTIQGSRGTVATVTVQRIDGRLSILVQDNGVGFDTQAKASSFGIASMYERAARAGAELTLTSSASGTQVWITLTI